MNGVLDLNPLSGLTMDCSRLGCQVLELTEFRSHHNDGALSENGHHYEQSTRKGPHLSEGF